MQTRHLWLGWAWAATLLAGCGNSVSEESSGPAGFLRSQLAGLSTLPAPEGVAADDWAELKSALAENIEQRLAATKETREARSASTAPVSDGARSPLKYDLDAQVFLWRYYSPGDYNQDGEVNISDLTALAAHLGEAVGTAPGAEDSIQAVIDGDGNGLITIADLTPLGANLGRRVTEFRLYFAGSLDAYPATNSQDPQVPSLSAQSIGNYLGNRVTERVRYELPEDLADGYYWIRPVDATAASYGTASTSVRGSEPRPIPKLVVDPIAGEPPFSATLNATGSYSYQGETKFYFDPDGDGNFVATGSNAIIGHAYETAAYHNPAVRVESLGGLLKSATLVVNTTGQPRWFRYPLPAPPTPEWIPQGLTLAEHQGWPYALLRYFDQTEQLNKYAQGYASSSTGSTWPPIPNWHIGSTQALGPVVMAALPLDGTTARLESHGSILFFRRAGPNPFTWEPQVNVFGGAAAIEWYSLKTIGLFPCVAYYDPGNDKLGFKRSTEFDGSQWPAQTTYPWGPTVGLGKYASLAAIDGKPGIAFWTDAGSIYYVSASDAQGSAWNVSVWLGNMQSARFFDNLLRLPDGSPALVFAADGFAETRLMIRRANDSSGADWDDYTFIAEYNPVVDFMPRALMVGNTAHVFWCPGTDELLHSQALDSSGLAWTQPEIVATGINGAVWPAPAEIAGSPAVGYVNAAGEFRFAIRY